MRDPHLDKLINDLKTKKFREEETKGLMDKTGEELKKMFGPAVAAAIKEGLAGIKMPEMPRIPETRFPDIPAPVVNIPAAIVNVPAPVIHIPETIIPPYPDFPSEMGLSYNLKNPLPVRWVDIRGNDVQLPFGGGGGGRGDFFTIKDIQNSSGGSIIDADGNLKVAGSFSVTASNSSTQAIDSSGTPYSQANPFPVVFSASASTASALIDSTGVQYSGSNPFPVTNIGLPVGQGDSATAQRVIQAGDSVASVVVNSMPAVVVTSVTNSIAATLVDSTGVGFSGSNPLPIAVISTVTQNINMVGGGNESVFTYMARTTNPTAVADGADVRPKADKLGRTLIRPIQVRDLIKTAYATVSTQAETTILTGTTSAFNDLIMLTATNASAAAWKVDIRASVGGNIVHTMNVPANTGPIGFAPPVPYPAADLGATWTATISSGTDVSNANLFFTGLFSQEL